MQSLAKFIATFGGAGYLPKAPGTWGSIAALCVYFLVYYSLGSDAMLTYALLLLAFISYWAGVWAVKKLQQEWGSDPAKVVVDEACGIFITLLPFEFSWLNVLLGFILFRIFDIWKPFGIRKIDSWHTSNGHTVMLDDVAAGVYAAVVLWFINLWLI